MIKIAILALFLFLIGTGSAIPDIVNPSTLTIKEISPGQYSVVLTLPVINGRVLKAKPVLPEICVVKGDPVEQGTSASVIRTWSMECAPDNLVGESIGVSGLLGTSLDIQLTIETLDGRKHVQPLRPTKPYFTIPPPPAFTQLAWDATRKGAERVLRYPELVVLVLVSVLLGMSSRSIIGVLVTFASAGALGSWLSGQNWMTMSPFIPGSLTAFTALLAALEIVRGRSGQSRGWHRPLWRIMLFIGLLYGAAEKEIVQLEGLSRIEQHMAFALGALGGMAGLALLILSVRELRAVLTDLSDMVRERMIYWIGYLSGILACALFLYEVSTPVFIGGTTPSVPIVTLVTVAVLGLWCRVQHTPHSGLLALTAGAFFAAGIIMSFSGFALPLTTMVAFGMLSLLGATFLFSIRWSAWKVFIVVAVVTTFHGHYAGQHLDYSTSAPVANAFGMGALLAFLYYAFYGSRPGEISDMTRLSYRVCGTLTAVLAILWRLGEYREWFGDQIAAEVAMGLLRLPVLALAFLFLSWLFWPRKRLFNVQREGAAPVIHWVLLALAFFAFPIGTWRVHNPLFTPRAPTVTEATHIMDRLLTDTYLAFNLQDENEAFDNLEANLSEELVADVYLDSRRRLTAGTRQGAQVTVKDVSVMSVEEATSDTRGETSFTYPCKWIVTARVKHLQHIHDRQNIYLGELTIRVEDDRWKITKLNLKSEERVILSWQRT